MNTSQHDQAGDGREEEAEIAADEVEEAALNRAQQTVATPGGGQKVDEAQ
ncbi:MAG: hypothetical protein U0703_13980 [Anaerolineae bacterium]